LVEIKAIVAQNGKRAFTHTALINSAAMGLSGNEVLDVVFSLSRSMFYKSMTTINDATLWQDVYHAPCPNGKTAYIKVTLRSGAVVIQFKEK
jgi:motility quorum-sensing regulator/GCU-specific mRNA interferase toxin